MGKPYTPDRAYRLSVLPLGIFMVFGAGVMLASSTLMPPEGILIPAIADPSLKRAVFFGLSLPLLPLGVGFCYRSKAAWQGFFVLMAVGIVGHVIGGVLDPQFASFVVLSPAINLPILVGIYFATRPAFISNAR